jgi:hypothetical protein
MSLANNQNCRLATRYFPRLASWPLALGGMYAYLECPVTLRWSGQPVTTSDWLELSSRLLWRSLT